MNSVSLPNTIASESTRFSRVLVTSLFFLWGFALNLNPILIPHLKKACQLTDTESALIDSASYIAYFLMAIPAGLFMKRFGYKGGIILGLLLFSVGSFLFFPAAETRLYLFFLFALFVIASGLTFLETAANPYITKLGDPESATQRLNLAQSFNGLAATLAPLVGGYFILSNHEVSNTSDAKQLTQYLDQEASLVQLPFIIIGFVVLLVAALLWKTKLPEISESDEGVEKSNSLFKETNLMLGVVAQFFCVGAQVCVSSFFIRFSGHVAGIEQQTASYFLSAALLGFMIGRFVGTFLMKFISPSRLLAIYSIFNIVLLLSAVTLTGKGAVYALMGVEFFMSIMFPTIFSLSIRGLGSRTKEGSSLVIMAIVGGAIFPLIMGWISDVSNIQLAYLVPAVCYLFVLYFAIRNQNINKVTLINIH
ncbi:MAG: L-fucose:H+ symporter permease [Chryseolinea sp.]